MLDVDRALLLRGVLWFKKVEDLKLLSAFVQPPVQMLSECASAHGDWLVGTVGFWDDEEGRGRIDVDDEDGPEGFNPVSRMQPLESQAATDWSDSEESESEGEPSGRKSYLCFYGAFMSFWTVFFQR